LWSAATVVLGAVEPAKDVELLEVRKIWDHAPHNAFTDLLHFRDEWFCVFREGQAHVSPDGALRVITSQDGKKWTSAALLTHARGDLRDAKLTLTPDNRLMLSGAVAWHQPSPYKHQSLVWFSEDGHAWGEALEIGQADSWLWRITWNEKSVFSVGYSTTGLTSTCLYVSRDGHHFDLLVEKLLTDGKPNEASLLFLPDRTGLCLLRREAPAASAVLGVALAPYTNWVWKDLGLKLGGPNLLRLPDGRIVAAGRLSDGKARTSLLWLDAQTGRATEFLKLPSGGDNSYPGLVWRDGLLWVSYYSSHEGKASIYLARVKLSNANGI
jgi:hypothetical protein